MIRSPQRLLDPNVRWIEPQTGRPTREFYQYMSEIDRAVREIIARLDDLESRVTDLETP